MGDESSFQQAGAHRRGEGAADGGPANGALSPRRQGPADGGTCLPSDRGPVFQWMGGQQSPDRAWQDTEGGVHLEHFKAPPGTSLAGFSRLRCPQPPRQGHRPDSVVPETTGS